MTEDTTQMDDETFDRIVKSLPQENGPAKITTMYEVFDERSPSGALSATKLVHPEITKSGKKRMLIILSIHGIHLVKQGI